MLFLSKVFRHLTISIFCYFTLLLHYVYLMHIYIILCRFRLFSVRKLFIVTRYQSDVVVGGTLSQRNLHQSQSNASVWTKRWMSARAGHLICTRRGIITFRLSSAFQIGRRRGQWWHFYNPPQFESHCWISLGTPGVISTHDHGDQNRYFKAKPGSFTNPNQMLFVSKPCRSIHTGLWQERNWKFNPNKCKVGTSKHPFWNLSAFFHHRTGLGWRTTW